MPIYNLIAYTSDNVALFGRRAASLEKAKKIIVNHGMLAKINHVIFKGKRYTIERIYKL